MSKLLNLHSTEVGDASSNVYSGELCSAACFINLHAAGACGALSWPRRFAGSLIPANVYMHNMPNKVGSLNGKYHNKYTC
jgi:hypothetical protein